MALAVSHQPLTAEAGFQFQAGRCEICGAQSGTASGFSPSTFDFPCQYQSCRAPYSCFCTAVTCRAKGASLGTLQKRNALSGIEERL